MIGAISNFAYQAYESVYPHLSNLQGVLKNSLLSFEEFSFQERLENIVSRFCDEDCYTVINDLASHALHGGVVGFGVATTVGHIYNTQVRRVQKNFMDQNKVLKLFVARKNQIRSPLEFNVMTMARQGFAAGVLIEAALFALKASTQGF